MNGSKVHIYHTQGPLSNDLTCHTETHVSCSTIEDKNNISFHILCCLLLETDAFFLVSKGNGPKCHIMFLKSLFKKTIKYMYYVSEASRNSAKSLLCCGEMGKRSDRGQTSTCKYVNTGEKKSHMQVQINDDINMSYNRD